MNLRTALATAATFALTLAPVTVAHADTDPHQKLAEDYTSLSGSLIGFYAEKSNMSLQSYLDSQQLLLKPSTLAGFDDPAAVDGYAGSGDLTLDDATQPAAPAPSLGSAAAGELSLEDLNAELGALDIKTLSAQGGLLLSAEQAAGLTGQVQPLAAADVKSLETQLAAGGVSISTKGFKDLSQVAKAVTRSARTPDGAIALASAKWAKDLADLRTPKLKGVKAPDAAMPTVPAEALPLGLLMNKSLTNLVTNHPNLVAQAQSSGLGSKKLVKAWNQSMASAYATSGKDLVATLPNPCVGDMLAVMATGKAKTASGKCSQACVVAGQYLHAQSSAVFDPATKGFNSNATNPAGGVVNSAHVKSMPEWAQGMFSLQSPQLTGPSAMGTPGNGPMDCADASRGAKNTMTAQLPGLFNALR